MSVIINQKHIYFNCKLKYMYKATILIYIYIAKDIN